MSHRSHHLFVHPRSTDPPAWSSPKKNVVSWPTAGLHWATVGRVFLLGGVKCKTWSAEEVRWKIWYEFWCLEVDRMPRGCFAVLTTILGTNLALRSFCGISAEFSTVCLWIVWHRFTLCESVSIFKVLQTNENCWLLLSSCQVLGVFASFRLSKVIASPKVMPSRALP